jgi:hypothetical protein
VKDTDLVRLVDKLEEEAAGYLTLDNVQAAVGSDVSSAIAKGLLLVDHRTRLDGASVTLCRLNRHHPLVIDQLDGIRKSWPSTIRTSASAFGVG